MRSRGDLLDVIARLENRVSALETGAHPIPSGLEMRESVAKTILADQSSNFNWYSSGSYTQYPYVRKSNGVVTLSGSFAGNMSLVDQTGAVGETLTTIPSTCLADADLFPYAHLRSPADSSSVYDSGSVLLKISGLLSSTPGVVKVFNHKPWTLNSGGYTINFDGISWITDDDA